MRWPGAALRAGPPWRRGSRSGRRRSSDVRVHGTTHERPIDRFAREDADARSGSQPPYHYTRAPTADRRRRCARGDRRRRATRCRSATSARRSTSARPRPHYVHRRRRHLHRAACEGRPPRGRDGAGALRRPAAPRRPGRRPTPPHWDPAYHALGAVEVRDLTVYETADRELGGANEHARSSIASAQPLPAAAALSARGRAARRSSSRPPSATSRLLPTSSTSSSRSRSAPSPRST